MLILDAGFVLRSAMKLMKVFMTKETSDKMILVNRQSLLNQEQPDPLLEFVTKQNLPPLYDGEWSETRQEWYDRRSHQRKESIQRVFCDGVEITAFSPLEDGNPRK